jgi:hypothetical protein
VDQKKRKKRRRRRKWLDELMVPLSYFSSTWRTTTLKILATSQIDSPAECQADGLYLMVVL